MFPIYLAAKSDGEPGNGYQGGDYVLVGDQLVIVDPSARRVVALVPNIG
jgi:hypothetical protein